MASRSPLRRWSLRLLGGLVALPVLYLVAAFLFLGTGLGPRLLNRPSSRVQISWQGGYSVWPGVLHVRGLRLDGRTRRGTWHVQAPDAELRHEILPLTRRTFLATSVRATGTEAGWTSHPPVELPPRPARDKPGWRLLFQDIDIESLVGLEVDGTEIDAAARPGRANLRLDIEIRGPFSAPHLQLILEDAELRHDQEALGRLGLLRIDGDLKPFVPRQNRGTAWLRFASAELEILSDAWDLGSASYFFRGAPVELDGRGHLEADLDLEAGVLQPSSRLEVTGGAIELTYAGYRAEGEGSLSLEAEEETAGARLQLVLQDFALGRLGKPPHVEGSDLRLVGTGPVLDLVDPAPEIVAELRVEAARVPDFASFDATLPARSPLRLTGGRGEIGLQLRYDSRSGELSGDFDLTGKQVEARYQQQQLTGDLRLGAHLDRGDVATRRFQLSEVRLDLDQVRTGKVEGWWARIELPRGTAVLNEPMAFDADSSAVLRDVLPLITLLRRDAEKKRWLHRLLEQRRVQATAHLSLDDEALTVAELEIRGGRRLTSRGDFRLSDRSNEGLVLVEYGPLSMAAELLPGNRREYKWTGSRRWFEERRALAAGDQH